MRIGAIAAAAGVPAQTIRYYEQIELLSAPARTPAGYRDYSQSVIGQLRFIRAAQAIGLTLGEIREILAFVGMGGAYITMLTAFYVDNGPRLPLWNQLPPVSFWFLPAAVGLPVLLRALRRHLRRPPPLRSSAADRVS